MAKKFNEGNMERNGIQNISEQNKAVETELGIKVESILLKENTI